MINIVLFMWAYMVIPSRYWPLTPALLAFFDDDVKWSLKRIVPVKIQNFRLADWENWPNTVCSDDFLRIYAI